MCNLAKIFSLWFLSLACATALASIKRDYYEVLGVAKNASADDIKKVYRQLAMKHHPDRPQNRADPKPAEARFKEAKEAYEMLSDTSKRAAYDQYGFAGVDSSNRSSRSRGGPQSFNDDDGAGRGFNESIVYHVSTELMNLLRKARPGNMADLEEIALDYLRARVNLYSSYDEIELNTKLNVAADIWTRTGPLAAEDHPDAMEAAYRAAFSFIKGVFNIRPERYEYYFNYGYEALNTRWKMLHRDPDPEDTNYRRHLWNAMKYARDTKIGNPAPAVNSGNNCAQFLRKATFTDANGVTYEIPITIEIKLGF